MGKLRHVIRWSLPEQQKIEAEGIRLLRFDPTLTPRDAVLRAQRLLPEDRRKSDYQFFYNGMGKALMRTIKDGAAAQLADGTPAQLPITEDPQHSPDKLEELRDPRTAERDARITELEGQVETMRSAFEELTQKNLALQATNLSMNGQLSLLKPDPLTIGMREVGRYILSGLRDAGEAMGEAMARKLSQELAQNFSFSGGMQSHANNGNGNGEHKGPAAHEPGTVRLTEPPQPTPEDRAGNLDARFHRPKLAIACLLNPQQSEIRETFKHLDFRFIPHELKHQQAQEVAGNCDVVISMTKFLRHTMEGAIKKGADQKKREFIRCNGGLSQLKQIIISRFGQNAIQYADKQAMATAH